MKKLLLLGLGLLGLPFIAFGAFDDVTLTTDTRITVGSDTLSVYGESGLVESIAVGSSNFTVTLASTSAVTFKSSSGKTLSTSGASAIRSNSSCENGASYLTLANESSSSSVTVTVTIGSACSTNSSGGGGGGGGGGTVSGLISGGGGGGSSVSVATPAASSATTQSSSASTLQAQIDALLSQVGALGGSSSFTRDLQVGDSGADVASLQTLLESKGFLTMPAGVAKGTFGGLTKAALVAYQKNIGVNATGYFGPKTRASVGATPVASAPSSATVPVTKGTLTAALSAGVSHSDVKLLQQVLNSDPDTRIADSGVGSSGYETEYYGAKTRAAVEKFQVKHGIAGPGDAGFGNVGPKTRAKLNSL